MTEERLGAGGMGEVWRVHDPRTGERAALKLTRVSPGLLGTFRRELALLAGLRHPGIVRLLDHGVDDGSPWYAMELVDGVTLRQQVSTWASSSGGHRPPTTDTTDLDRLPELPDLDEPAAPPGALDDVLALARRLASTLAWLHGEGLVHGDLKPENVLIRPDGRPVLLDFGLSARFAAAGHEVLDPGQGGGTVAYMAPEQIRAEPLDGRADLYALGVMLWEALVGERPFLGEPRAVLEMHLRRRPAPPSMRVAGLPPEVDELVLRLLAKDRRQRFQRASEVVAALEALGADAEPGPRPRVALVRPSFVGRDQELAAADGALVLAHGPSGVGRTRFALEAARRRAKGTVVLAASGDGPLGPLVRILAMVADRCLEAGPETVEGVLGARAAILAPHVPAVTELSAATAPLAELPAAAARDRLFRAIAEVLARAAEERPLLLVLDDLHRSGELCAGFLAGLLDAPIDRVRVLGTVDEDRAPEALRALLDSPRVTAVPLGPLDDGALAEIVRELAGAPLPHAVRLAAGRPVVAAEAVRLALERPGAAPATLSELVEQRLSLVPELAPWLRLAALDGEELDPERLSAVLGDPTGPLAWLERDGWIEGEPLRFTSETLRRAIVDALPPDERRALHLRLAELPDDEPARTGRHLVAAGERDRARPFLFRAARQALARSALAEGLALWRTAIEGAPADAEVLNLRHDVGYALYGGAGGFEGALAEARAVVDGARALGRADLEAEGLRMVGVASWNLGRAEDAVAAHEAAIARATQAGEDLTLARALTDLGALDQDQGRADLARERYQRAIALLAGRDRRAEAVARINLAGLDADAGRAEAAIAGFERALAVLRGLGDRRLEGIVLGNLGNALAEARRPEDARRAYAQSLAVHRAIGNRRSEAVALLNVAILDAEGGRFELARPAFAEALQVHRSLGNRRFAGLVHLFRARWEIRAPDGAGIEEDLDAAEALLREVGDRTHLVLVACERGHHALATGADARPWLEEAARRAEGLGPIAGDPVEVLWRALGA